MNSLAEEIKEAGLGINIELDESAPLDLVSILLYADDIVCLSENETDLQSILVIIESWCKRWRLEVNLTKTNILHVRKQRKRQSQFCFLFNHRPVPYCDSYKYLGVNINKNLNFPFTVDKQAEAAERALSSIITKMIKNQGFPFSVFSMLYNACVSSVSDYSAGVTGFSEYASLMKLQLRAIRSFLGVPKNAPNAGVLSEVNWLLPKFRTRVAMIRLYHRLINMNNTRLPKKIFLWDKHLNQTNLVSTWYNEVRDIFSECNLELMFNMGVDFDLKFTSEYIEKKYREIQSVILKDQCLLLPKLRTFLLIKEFDNDAVYIKKPLNFILRRLISRTRLGCLPLRVETGRYTVPRLPEDRRVCLVCDSDGQTAEVETEIHLLFSCRTYVDERDKWFQAMNLPPNFESLTVSEKLKIVFNESANIKPTAIFIDRSLSLRNRALNLL